ncbi:MAG: Na+/H+ antiporter NhaC family protein [Clostridia bacterium]|nr:Na+/H+ antiporter NhaC family protein [Clostridia bacterium]
MVTAIVAALAVIAVVVLAIVLPKEVQEGSIYYGTFISLVPPIIAIGLALITKEVFSSLFAGVLVGAIFASNYSFAGTLDIIVVDGLSTAVADSAGIFVFLVILGILVSMINKSGGTEAFGRWAKTHVKTKMGAMLATFVLGVLIFVDDYFNCLTVGAVMRPVTDSHKISRVKLAYIIDATAAPICMIAPVSSWAAAVSGTLADCNVDTGLSSFQLFVNAIPFNFYSLLTIVFVVTIAVLGFDYGKMSGHEIKANKEGDLGALGADEEVGADSHGIVLDLVLPIVVLIVSCVLGLMYVGGFFKGGDFQGDFIGAFGNTDAYVALPWGGMIALVFAFIYYLCRKCFSFKEATECIPQGFIAMVPAITILTLATALKNVTGLLGSDAFIDTVMAGVPEFLYGIFPALIFVVACVLSFATGTSWGTFGILIPIVVTIFGVGDPLFYVGISACLAGAVCGDHCSPISDTTIMASAGANCNHVDHVSTQLPYAITVAAISFVSFLFAGFVPIAWIALPFGIVLTVGTLFVIRYLVNKKNATAASESAE